MNALYTVACALFLWAECFECVGLRTFVRWWRS